MDYSEFIKEGLREFDEYCVDLDKPSSPGEAAGDTIGRYKLLQELGTGGMGLVWMAEQSEPVKRKVALKIIKLGMDTREVVTRFEAERQALALMDHPHIAKVFDGGSTESGRPYFVMELVKGSPITQYCDHAKLGVAERLALFVKVCDALQHAHQKGIIHRDVKPSNVMITLHDGVPVPKVIDFGVAKATSAELTQKTLFTKYAQVIGTPQYMAPEQAEMSGLDIDTRADVYSLGVLLYELLTGTTPIDLKKAFMAGYAEIVRTIREVDPAKPSTRVSTMGDAATPMAENRHVNVEGLSRHLRGELDWIVMRALEKDRTRRYDGASALGQDIQRYLNQEPVLAAPPSQVYRLTKLLRRRRKTVISVGAMVLLLIAGTAGTAMGWWKSVQARESLIDALAVNQELLGEKDELLDRETHLKEKAQDAVEDLNSRTKELQAAMGFQEAQLSSLNVENMGVHARRSLVDLVDGGHREELAAALEGVNFADLARRILRESFVGSTTSAIEEQFSSRPLLRAQMQHSAGITFMNLGLHESAESVLRQSLAIRKERLDPLDPVLLSTMRELSRVLRFQNKWDEAAPLCRNVLEGRRLVLGDKSPDTLISINDMGYLSLLLDEPVEAQEYFEEVLELGRGVLRAEDPTMLAALQGLGRAHQAQGRYLEAETCLSKTVEGYRRELGVGHIDSLAANAYLVSALLRLRNFEKAEQVAQEALEVARQARGDENSSTLNLIKVMGDVMSEQGKSTTAEAYYRQAIDGSRRVLGAGHRNTLVARNALGDSLRQQGRWSEAEEQFIAVVDGLHASFSGPHYDTFIAISGLASVLHSSEKLEESEQLYREALAGMREVRPEGHLEISMMMVNLGQVLADQDKRSEAGVYYRAALASQRQAFLEEDPRVIQLVEDMSSAFRYRANLARAKGADGYMAEYSSFLGACLVLRGEFIEAQTLLEEALMILIELDPADERQHQLVINDLSAAIAGQGNYSDAEHELVESSTWLSTYNLSEEMAVEESACVALAMRRVIELYESWATAGCGADCSLLAEEWKEKLAAWQKPG